mmetsp:Transcript_33072/g.72849  ORF Transcript_33072/g.72849 Transcript_33072/m.72849 type:complete len:303 (+) Transcript_33072:82-990(+)
MSGSSNKRKLSDEEEQQVLGRIAAGEKYHSIAPAFGISITTVCKIKKGRPDHDAENERVEHDSSKKLAEYYPLLNARMLEWVVQAQKRNIRMTSKMLQDRAKIIADSIGWSAFRGSSGWCVKFLRRNNIKLRSIKRSAQLKAACKEGTSWETRILNPKLDETGALVPDSEEDEEEAMEDEEEDDEEPRPPTFSEVRRSWQSIQEWFIAHPPRLERVQKAIYTLNREMLQDPDPASKKRGASGASGGKSSAGSSSNGAREGAIPSAPAPAALPAPAFDNLADFQSGSSSDTASHLLVGRRQKN